MSAAVNAPFFTSSVAVFQPRISASCRAGSRAAALERRDGGGEELEDVPRRQVDPARDRQHAARLEVPQVFLQRLDRVQVALRERVEPRRRRAERIEQRDLDQVEAVAVRGDEAARLADVDAHAGCAVRRPGELREPPLHQIDDLRIELDRVDAARVVVERLQHVGAGARAEHQHPRPREQMVRQGGGELVEIGERLAPAVVARQARQAVAVGEHRELRRGFHRRGEAQARRVPERDAARFRRR